MIPSRRIQSRIDSIESSIERMKHALHCGVSSNPTLNQTGELNDAYWLTRIAFSSAWKVSRSSSVAKYPPWSPQPVIVSATRPIICLTLRSRSGDAMRPRKYFWATMFVAVCDQNFGNSTSRCSKTGAPLPGINASRVSHSISSKGSRPGIVKNRRGATLAVSSTTVLTTSATSSNCVWGPCVACLAAMLSSRAEMSSHSRVGRRGTRPASGIGMLWREADGKKTSDLQGKFHCTLLDHCIGPGPTAVSDGERRAMLRRRSASRTPASPASAITGYGTLALAAAVSGATPDGRGGAATSTAASGADVPVWRLGSGVVVGAGRGRRTRGCGAVTGVGAAPARERQSPANILVGVRVLQDVARKRPNRRAVAAQWVDVVDAPARVPVPDHPLRARIERARPGRSGNREKCQRGDDRRERADEATTGAHPNTNTRNGYRPNVVEGVLRGPRWAALAAGLRATAQIAGAARGEQKQRQPAENEQRDRHRRRPRGVDRPGGCRLVRVARVARVAGSPVVVVVVSVGSSPPAGRGPPAGPGSGFPFRANASARRMSSLAFE